MDKNITVENLVKLFDNDKTADKKNFYSQIKIEAYIPYLTKVEVARRIVEATCLKEGRIVMDSASKYLLYCRSIISLYTNIKLAEKADENEDMETLGLMMLNEFDALNSRGLFEGIFAKIPEKELAEFNTVLDMVSNDIMTNKYEPHAYVDEVLSNLMSVLSTLSDVVDKLNAEEVEKAIAKVNE